MTHALLMPVRMSNADKDRMLDIAKTIPDAPGRIAAWMNFDLPEGLIEALTEMENTY